MDASIIASGSGTAARWVNDNRQWLFDGAGVALIAALVTLGSRRLQRRRNVGPPNRGSGTFNRPKPDPATLKCSFCGKGQRQIRKLIAGPGVYVCDECIELCSEILDEELVEKAVEGRAEQIERLCELTIMTHGPSISSTELSAAREEIHQLSSSLRSKKREHPGDILAEAALVRVIGAGSFGTVWEARRLQPTSREDEVVAVKVFDQDKLGIGLTLWRFHRGIRAMRHLSSLGVLVPRSVVRLFDVDEGLLAFSMPYLPGGDLEGIKRFGWDLSKRLDIFTQVAEGIHFAHQHGVIHRDIKPANIVLDSTGCAVVTDFDIADIQFAKTQTMFAGGLGTPQFAAPEQLVGAAIAAERTADIYSLGKLLYFLIKEEAPPLGSSEDGAIPPYLTRLHEPHGFRLTEGIAKAISHDPGERFQHVEEMVKFLGLDFSPACVSSF